MKILKTTPMIFLACCIAAAFVFSACMKEEINTSKISTLMELNPEFAGPLVKGSQSIKDLYDPGDQEEDTIIVYDGDSVKVIFSVDTIAEWGLNKYRTIQRDVIKTDEVVSPIFVPSDISGSQRIQDTNTLSFSDDFGMRVDSIFMEGGNLEININNQFDHPIGLSIYSRDIITPAGSNFGASSNLQPNSSATLNFPLEDYRIYFEQTEDTLSTFEIMYDVSINKQSGSPINVGDKATIQYNFTDMQEYEAIFGYVAQKAYSVDTTIESPLEDIDNLSGRLSVKDPRITFKYSNSFGAKFDAELSMQAIFNPGYDPELEPDVLNVAAQDNYLSDPLTGSETYTRNEFGSDLDSLIRIPPPDSINVYLASIINPEDPDTSKGNIPNFVLNDSRFIIGMDVEVPLELTANMRFTDTVDDGLESEDLEEIDEIEYIRLYYEFRNEFPLDIGVSLVMYDSINDIEYSTIELNENDDYFLKAAPVDNNGLVMLDNVQMYEGMLEITKEEYETLKNLSTSFIVNAEIRTTQGAEEVTILNTYELGFRFMVDAKFKIKTE